METDNVLNLKLDERTIKCKIIKLPIMKTEKLKRLYKVKVNYTREGWRKNKQYKYKFYLELPDSVAKKDVGNTINDIVGNSLGDDVMVFSVTYSRVKNALRFISGVSNEDVKNIIGELDKMVGEKNKFYLNDNDELCYGVHLI